jgi:parvulin-like peptidyl-prolyl isomerase
LHTSASFDRKGPSDSSIADKAKFAEAAFALTDNSVSDVVEMPDGYYILQLNEEIPSEIPPLEALAEAVRADAKVAKQRDKARQAAQEMLDAVRGGQDFAAAAKAREQVVQNTGLFGRQGPVGSIGMAGELAAAAFRLSKDAPMPETVFNVKQRWYVVRFDQRESPDDAGFGSQKERIMAQLRQQKQYQALDALLARLRTQSRIDIKNDML